MDTTSSPEISTLQAAGAVEGKGVTLPQGVTLTAESKKVIDAMAEMAKHRSGKEMIQRAGELGTGQITKEQIGQLKDRLMTKSKDAAGNRIDDPATVELVEGVTETAVYFEAYRRASAIGLNPHTSGVGETVLTEYYGPAGQNNPNRPSWTTLETRVLDRFMGMDVVRGALPQLWELKFETVPAGGGAAQPAAPAQEAIARRGILKELLVTSPRLRSEMGKEMKKVVDSVTEKVSGTPQELAEKEAELVGKDNQVDQIEARVKGVLQGFGVADANERDRIWNGVKTNPVDAGTISQSVMGEVVVARFPGNQTDFEDVLRQIKDLTEDRKTQMNNLGAAARGQNPAAATAAINTRVDRIDASLTPLRATVGLADYQNIRRSILGETDSQGRTTGGLLPEITSLKRIVSERNTLNTRVTALRTERENSIVRHKLEHVRMLEQVPVTAITETLNSAYDYASQLSERKMAAEQAKAEKQGQENLSLGLRLVREGINSDYIHFDDRGQRIARQGVEVAHIRQDIIDLSRHGPEWRKRIVLRYLEGGPIILKEGAVSKVDGVDVANASWDKVPLEKLKEDQRKLIDDIDAQLGDQILKKLLTDYSQLTRAGEGRLVREFFAENIQFPAEVLNQFYEKFQDTFKAELEKAKNSPEVKRVLERRGFRLGLTPPSLLSMLLLAMGVGACSLNSLAESK